MSVHRLWPNIKQVIRERNIVMLRQMLEEWTHDSLGELMTNLMTSDQITVLRSLPLERGAVVFRHLPPSAQGHLLNALSPEEAASLLKDDETR
jgi:Mg/Co/Ni transporter MgtE